jgi:hypothetical protein
VVTFFQGQVPFSSEIFHRLDKNIDLKENLVLCINALQAMQSSEYFSLGVCVELRPSKQMGKSSKKSRAVSLHVMH